MQGKVTHPKAVTPSSAGGRKRKIFSLPCSLRAAWEAGAPRRSRPATTGLSHGPARPTGSGGHAQPGNALPCPQQQHPRAGSTPGLSAPQKPRAVGVGMLLESPSVLRGAGIRTRLSGTSPQRDRDGGIAAPGGRSAPLGASPANGDPRGQVPRGALGSGGSRRAQGAGTAAGDTRGGHVPLCGAREGAPGRWKSREC